LEGQEVVYQNVDHVFDTATVDPYFIWVAVLKNDVDERLLHQRLGTVHAPEFLHVFAHSSSTLQDLQGLPALYQKASPDATIITRNRDTIVRAGSRSD
jgi:hypothetical protein